MSEQERIKQLEEHVELLASRLLFVLRTAKFQGGHIVNTTTWETLSPSAVDHICDALETVGVSVDREVAHLNQLPKRERAKKAKELGLSKLEQKHGSTDKALVHGEGPSSSSTVE